MKAEARKTAIDVVGDVPWGTHFCQFYRERAELVDILVPYFKAGLENNELCVWITSEPLNAGDAYRALKDQVRNLDDHVAAGRIEILDYRQWYTRSGSFDCDEVLQGWAEKERFALRSGFEGLRITANTSWIDKELWGKFTNYEVAAHESITKSRILAVCAYWLDKCSASDIVDVVSNHQFAIIRQNGAWRIIESPAHKRAYEALRLSEQRYRSYVEVTGQLGWTTNADGEVDQDISTWRQFTGQSEDEVRGWGWSKALHPDDRERAEQSWRDAVKARRVYEAEYRIRRHDGIYRQFLARSVPVIEADGTVREWVGTCVDVTERKGAERELRLRNRIAQVLLTIADDRMYGEVLDVLRESCESEYGFFGYIDENGDLVSPSLTRDIWDRCKMADKTIVFARETWGDSIWGRAMNSRRSQLSNTPLGTPEGHVKIDRALNVPVVYDTKSIGVISLANKHSDYTPEDLRLLESIAGFIAPVLHARLQRKRDLAQIESLARFSSENPNPVLRIATDGTVLYANAAGSGLIATWGCKTGERAPENWRQYVNRILESGENEALEAFCGDRIFSLIMTPVKDAGYANVYGIDVTERRRAEESLREYRHHLEDLVQTRTAEFTQANEKLLQENEERKRLEKEILNIGERERRRIGRELHDSIGQQFTDCLK